MKHIDGYTSYGFDAVVKFGGSLLIDEKCTASAIRSLEATLAAGKSVLVMPGGGPTDKTIEAIDAKRPLQPLTHHRACARAQDQTGLIICDPAYSSKLVACETLTEARQVQSSGLIPVLLPSHLIFTIDPFEMSWEITSDGMAVWLAWLVRAPLTAVLTDVDGVFVPGSDFQSASPVAHIAAAVLCDWGQTSVDRCVPAFLESRGGRAWVGHGRYEDRLVKALLGEPVLGTFIEGRFSATTQSC